MKRVNLFGLLLAASAMTLASCGETRTPDKGSHVSAWPANSIASFLTKQEVKDGTVVPTFKADSYTFSVKKDESTNFEWFEMYAYTKDEASFTSYIEKAKGDSWTVVSDDKGAVATKGEVGMEFNKYSKDGVFKSVDFRIYSLAKKDASGGGSSSSSSGGTTSGTTGTTGTTTTGGGGGGGGTTYKDFPTADLTTFLNENSIVSSASELILPQSTAVWSTDSDVGEDGTPYFCAYTNYAAALNAYKTAITNAPGWNCEEYTDSSDGSTYYEVTCDDDNSFGIQFYMHSTTEFDWVIYPSGGSGGQTSEGFPTDAANEFVSTQSIASGVTMQYPSADATWSYSIASDIFNGAYFTAEVSDSGTVGTDSLEDTYKKLLEDTAGWTIDASQYDTAGYFATYTGHEDEFKIEFMTAEGDFSFYLFDLTSVLTSTGFPATAANSFASDNEIATGTTLEFPNNSTDTYYYGVIEDAEYGDYFQASCEDAGTVGTDSIEDAYKALLQGKTGWTVDDSQYSDLGYVATFEGDETFYINFYTYGGYFTFYLNIESSGGGGGGTISGDSVTFADLGYSDGEEVPTLNLDNCTISFDVGTNGSGNAPKYYSTGESVRCYAGNTFTVSSSSTITKIELTFGSGDKTNTISTDVGTFSTDTWTGSAASVTFSIGGTKDHRRIASITVTLS